jgi:hypothetical protein
MMIDEKFQANMKEAFRLCRNVHFQEALKIHAASLFATVQFRAAMSDPDFMAIVGDPDFGAALRVPGLLQAELGKRQ